MKEAEILKSCKHRLEFWQIRGIVSRFERVNCGKVKTAFGYYIQLFKPDFPDYFALIPLGKLLHIAFFEVKRSEGGVISHGQLEFQKKHDNFINVSHDFITNPNQIDHRIEQLTGYTDNILESIDINGKESK